MGETNAQFPEFLDLRRGSHHVRRSGLHPLRLGASRLGFDLRPAGRRATSFVCSPGLVRTGDDAGQSVHPHQLPAARTTGLNVQAYDL